LILASIYLTLMTYLDKKIYAEGSGNDYSDIIMETAMYYTIIMAFMYVPALIFLNIISLLHSKFETRL